VPCKKIARKIMLRIIHVTAFFFFEVNVTAFFTDEDYWG